MSAVEEVATPAMPMPITKRLTRIVSSVGRNIPDNPATVNNASETNRVFALPALSAITPTNSPEMATASDGSEMISATIVSAASGNASLICGNAGATAAPPMQLSMETSRSATSVPLVGVKCFDLCVISPVSPPSSF